jgi:RNA polymerase sigma factor (sigma-70 family)
MSSSEAELSPDAPGRIRQLEVGRLLLQARAGDRLALDQIVDRLTPLVWNVVRARGLDLEASSDVVQSTWVALLEHLNDIRTPEALTGWLITVARRDAVRVRGQLKRDELVEPDALTDLPDPGDDLAIGVVSREQYRCLWHNLRKLSPRCQELLRIVAFADRPDYQAIAQALNMPRGSIGPNRGRCLAKLRALLAADPAWSPR